MVDGRARLTDCPSGQDDFYVGSSGRSLDPLEARIYGLETIVFYKGSCSLRVVVANKQGSIKPENLVGARRMLIEVSYEHLFGFFE